LISLIFRLNFKVQEVLGLMLIDFVLPTKLRFENKNESKIIPSELDYF
jgi:hypothetical protein